MTADAAGNTVDLHAHTDLSDSLLTPAALVDAAKQRGLVVLGLTDHDTTAGGGAAAVMPSAPNSPHPPAPDVGAHGRAPRQPNLRPGLGEGRRESAGVRATAIIVAAGRGERFGASDKVMAPLTGRPVLAYSLTNVSQAASIDDIVIVVAPHVRAAVERLVASAEWPGVRAIVDGGPRRQDSVAAGVTAVSAESDLVVIHDAVRPLAPADLFEACLQAAAVHGAAIAAMPVTDTLKRIEAEQIVETVSRAGLWAAQTPQAFRRELIVDALASAGARENVYTDEAALLEALGIPVTIVPGSARNLKITRPEDLAIAEAFLQLRETAR